MTQPDVALTDYALAIECLIFAFLLLRVRDRSRSLAFWYTIFFASAALAAGLGGTVHGFFPNAGSTIGQVLWLSTLICIGITALAGTRIGGMLYFKGVVAAAISRGAIIVFAIYTLTVLFVTRNFLAAIIDYLPITIFLCVIFLLAYRRTQRIAYLIGLGGLTVTLIAAAIQQAKLGIHPRYFDHNAVYHVLQAIGMGMLFTTARNSTSVQ